MNLVNNPELICEKDMEKVISWIIKIEQREANKHESDFIPNNGIISVQKVNINEFGTVENITERIEYNTDLISLESSPTRLSENKYGNAEENDKKMEGKIPHQKENNYEEIKDIILQDMRRVILRSFDK